MSVVVNVWRVNTRGGGGRGEVKLEVSYPGDKFLGGYCPRTFRCLITMRIVDERMSSYFASK